MKTFWNKLRSKSMNYFAMGYIHAHKRNALDLFRNRIFDDQTQAERKITAALLLPSATFYRISSDEMEEKECHA